MALFAGTSANENIGPSFVTESVFSNPAGARPSMADDVINGGGGDDVIDASGGDDIVVGGLGADKAILGQGDDIFRARLGDGHDVVNGGSGYDSYEWTGSDEPLESDYDSAGLELLASGIGLLDHSSGTLNDIERLRFDLGDGIDDLVSLYNHAGSSLERIEIVDAEVVFVEGDIAGERLTVRQQGALLTIAGLQAVVTIENLGDGSLYIAAQDGADSIDLTALGGSGRRVRVEAGDGNDLILAGARAEYLGGGDGSDRISYARSPEGVEIGYEGIAGVGGWAEGDVVFAGESLTGSAFADILGGTGSGNILAGGAGDDRLDALGGFDTLNGGAGGDKLDGGTGGDLMFGGAGDDQYRVDHSGDRMVERAGGGIDLAISAISLTLPAHVENLLFLEGAGPLTGRGNGPANEIHGNEDDNVLQGLGGADVLNGEAGNDLLNGGVGADVTSGGLGDDRIYGGAGADLHRGGFGLDRFFFDTALGGGVDTIDDFVAADDTIMLARERFGEIAAGTLAADAFVEGNAAQDAEDRLIYHKPTGRIFFDADGAGGAAQVLFARVDPATELSNLDFRGY
ncbi:MAG TPA: calcium-binding protein [Allosphingosinicella sp.]